MAYLRIIFVVAFCCSTALAQQKLAGECMGTTWNVTIAGTEVPNAQQLIQSELDRVDRLMSTWKDDSEVSRFNAFDSDEWFTVSPATATVVQEALAVAAATGGAFDITVSPLIDLWNFDRNTGRDSVPASEQIAAVREHVGYQQLQVRLNPPALKKNHPKLSINLSAIAKGYAVDRVTDALRRAGAKAMLVEVGGEVRGFGSSPKGKPWTVGIEEPLENQRAIRTAVPLDNRAMATSGDYRNFYVVDDKKYSHTIDPRTGEPVRHELASVSVLAESCMQADAWATAMMVLGSESSPSLPANVSALLISRQADETFVESAIGDFPSDPRNVESAPPTSTSMWPVFLAAAVVFLIAVAGMAVGVIISNKRLKGSCGGLAGITNEKTGETSCDLCAMPSPECRGEPAEVAAEQSVDA